ncbi:MAG: EamA family transporter [Clostridia bacterium]|nr:EamA family transporter [Clostridia bacterium]
MIPIQVILSISSMVLQNCLFNNVCKKDLTTNDHVYRFNIIAYAVCILLFGLSLIGGSLSLFTVLLALLFGTVTALSNLYKMRSLSTGPMHITLLITTSSMIIPTMSGVFFGEGFSIPKLILVIVLIGFLYLSLDTKKGGEKANRRWLFFCALAFLLQGSIGVLQKVHQSSPYKEETNGFLLIAFVCSLLYSRIRAKKSFAALHFNKKHVMLAVVCGLCTYCMNFLNLRLSGLLPSQLFFPLVNGSAIVLSSLMSVLLFKERLTRRQLVGLCGGILSLIGICLV